MSQKNYQNKDNFLIKHWQTLLIFVLIISNIAIYFSVKPDLQIDPGVAYRQQYPLLDGNRRLSDPKDLVVNLQDLRQYLKQLPEQNKDWAEMSIYFEVFGTGASVVVNQDLKLFPASLAKLPLAMVVMKKVESGEWALDKKIVLTKEDADLFRTPDIAQDIGRSYDVKFLIEQLIIESDNTAYRMLIKELTQPELDSIGEAVGLDGFFNDEGKISAKDYTRLLRVLYLAVYLNEDNSQTLLSLMQRSEHSGFLKGGIPNDVPFAHKWGTNLFISVYSDSGIVYVPKRPYMISVMIRGINGDPKVNEAKADLLMKEISQRAYAQVVR